jgi:hypothetical protein
MLPFFPEKTTSISVMASVTIFLLGYSWKSTILNVVCEYSLTPYSVALPLELTSVTIAQGCYSPDFFA